MAQILFIPFESKQAGNLNNMFNKLKGKDKGFGPTDRCFAPPLLKDNTYEKSHRFEKLTGADDQLWINGHGLRGWHKLATEQSCKAGGPEVDIPTLIRQIEAYGLPHESRAKVKLLACESGLGVTGQESFGVAFSKEMYAAKYTSCPIYAYKAKLFDRYMDLGKGLHKAVTATDEVKIRKNIASVRNWVATNFKPDERYQQQWIALWKMRLKKAQGDVQRAIEDIIVYDHNAMLIAQKQSLGAGTEGVRAKLLRIVLLNGMVIKSEEVAET
jgi:hypothetical protein